MLDMFGRKINYMRVSVTDRCNFRCVYCMAEEGQHFLPHEEVLTYEELLTAIKAAALVGIHRIRITGGEPLVRKGIVDFLYRIKREVPQIDDLAISTNGFLLPALLPDLKKAGVDRFNISLDSFDAAKFTEMTRFGRLEPVLQGINQALSMGFDPVKINCVVCKGYNDHEVLDFVRWSVEEKVHVRFIELMPLSAAHSWEQEGLFTAEQIRQRVREKYEFEPVYGDDAPKGAGPAKYYKIPGAKGTWGIISAVSECFCSGCNRIRLSCDGKLNPCLGHIHDTDIKPLLRAGATPEQVAEVISSVIYRKPKEHHFDDPEYENVFRIMSHIGG